MLEIVLLRGQVLDDAVAGERRREHDLRAQRQLAAARHLAKENQRRGEDGHLQPKRSFTEEMVRGVIDECRDRGDRAVHHQREVEDVKRRTELASRHRPGHRSERGRCTELGERDLSLQDDVSEIGEDGDVRRQRQSFQS